MLDLNNMLPGLNNSTNNKVTLNTTTLKIEEPPVVSRNISEDSNKVLPKKEALLQVLSCGKCSKILSVGKKQISSVFSYKLLCPHCKTLYVKKDYVVDTNSKLWHRPFTKKAQDEFDREISRLKAQLSYEEISL
jgi:uncharacterized protein YbaR (Trm112 family)